MDLECLVCEVNDLIDFNNLDKETAINMELESIKFDDIWDLFVDLYKNDKIVSPFNIDREQLFKDLYDYLDIEIEE